MSTFTRYTIVFVLVLALTACRNPFNELPNVVVEVYNVELMLCSTEDSRDWDDYYYLAIVTNFDGEAHRFQLKEVNDANEEIGQPIKPSVLFPHSDAQYSNLHIDENTRLFMLVECDVDTLDWEPCPNGDAFFYANDAQEKTTTEGIILDFGNPESDGWAATVEYTDADTEETSYVVAQTVYVPQEAQNNTCPDLIK